MKQATWSNMDCYTTRNVIVFHFTDLLKSNSCQVQSYFIQCIAHKRANNRLNVTIETCNNSTSDSICDICVLSVFSSLGVVFSSM